MPTNLPAEAKSKWKKAMEARTPEEKLLALQEFLSAVPKHKGTERLRMQVTRQIATLKKEIELKKKKRAGGGEQFFVEKEGDIQVVLLGLPGVGKQEFFKCVTGIEAVDSRKPVPGMKIWEGVYFQIINAPPFLGDTSTQSRLLGLARNADALTLIVDMNGDVEDQVRMLLRALEEARIAWKKPRSSVEIERKATGGIIVAGELDGATLQDVVSLLREYGIYHAVVRISGKATLDDVEDALFGEVAYKPTVIVIYSDVKGDDLRDTVLKVNKVTGVPVFGYTSCDDALFKEAAEYFFRELDLIRIYTRNPKTGEVEERPVVVKRGARVIEVARTIHSQLSEHFKYAWVWSNRFSFNPRKVGKDFELKDGDIVQIVGG
ncbi:MAG: TGS domain-containing protein [Infirmifilum sp.]